MNILNTIKRLGLIALFAFSPFLAQQTAAQPGYDVPGMDVPGMDVPVESFYDELAPYGQWNQHPNHGNVWSPRVEPDFQPYSSGGHWVMTEYGNTWVSDYAWGWAPFHYGRWIYDPAYGGWLWIPGTDWGPAWVSWRSGGGYYGWAPLGPGLNININIPAPYWTFVPQRHFTSPRWYSYCVPRPRVVNIYQNTTIINNYYRSNNRAYSYGPSRGDIERYTRQSVPVYRVDRMDRPGRSVIGNGSVGFYRPGQSSGYGQGYGRNDRFDNNSTPRSDYRAPRASSRGTYDANRGYNGSNSPMPNRNYERGNGNATGRGNYGGNYPADRTGRFENTPVPTPNSGNYNQPQPERFESSRGRYSPGNGPMEGNSQPNRSYERIERQGQLNSQSRPGGRSEGSSPRMSESRGMQSQPRIQEQSQRSNSEFNPGGRGQRGPR